MESRELDLLAFGVLLGDAKLRQAWMPDWTLEGSLAAALGELRRGEVGPAMERMLKRLGVDDGKDKVQVRVLRAAKERHRRMRRDGLAMRVLALGKMLADEATIDTVIKELADAVEEKARPSDDKGHDASKDAGRGSVPEAGGGTKAAGGG